MRSSFSFLSTGGVNITYQVLDPSKGDFKLPVLRIPMTFNVPFVVAGVPMLLKVSFALLVTVALSSENSTVRGGEKLTYSGEESVTESGGSDSAASKLLKIAGSFVTSKPSVTLSSAAVEVASQMKVGFGPGLAVANILGYGDVIVTIGQRTGTLVAGLPCSAFYLDVPAARTWRPRSPSGGSLRSRSRCSRRSTPTHERNADAAHRLRSALAPSSDHPSPRARP